MLNSFYFNDGGGIFQSSMNDASVSFLGYCYHVKYTALLYYIKCFTQVSLRKVNEKTGYRQHSVIKCNNLKTQWMIGSMKKYINCERRLVKYRIVTIKIFFTQFDSLFTMMMIQVIIRTTQQYSINDGLEIVPAFPVIFNRAATL